MCGIVGIVGKTPVAQSLYDGLTVIQHRGQDAAGIMTIDQNMFNLRKANGLVRDVFHTRHMKRLTGNMGIGMLDTQQREHQVQQRRSLSMLTHRLV